MECLPQVKNGTVESDPHLLETHKHTKLGPFSMNAACTLLEVAVYHAAPITEFYLRATEKPVISALKGTSHCCTLRAINRYGGRYFHR